MTDKKANTSESEHDLAEITVNDCGKTIDTTVVVDEPARSVILTDDTAIVIDKPAELHITPSNRPRKVNAGMWGPLELGVFGAALLILLGVFLYYLLFVAPSARELERNKAERDRLELELISAQSKYGNITSTETQVAKLVSSVDEFESSYLPVAANGRTSLYQRLNGLIVGYGLVNTNGPAYAPLELADQDQMNQNDEERGRERFRSLFPGVYVTMTVEGPYQNLRRFIREIETGNEFIVISSVELAPSESTAGTNQSVAATGPPVEQRTATINPITGEPVQTTPQAQAPRGRTFGERVALRLEMAAYFRRQNAAAESELGQ